MDQEPWRNLTDYHHQLVVQKAKELIRGVDTNSGKIEKLFYYTREKIYRENDADIFFKI